MKAIFSLALFLSLFLASCHSEPSLQQYFVTNTENKNFVALDLSPSILNIEPSKLTVAQNKALHSFEKMNVLAFKVNPKNQQEFVTERAKVATILKDTMYQQLIKFGSGKEGAAISYVGSDDHINEFVLFANKKEAGFAVIRVLGKDMNPENIMTLLSIIKDSKIDLAQLKPLQELIKK